MSIKGIDKKEIPKKCKKTEKKNLHKLITTMVLNQITCDAKLGEIASLCFKKVDKSV